VPGHCREIQVSVWTLCQDRPVGLLGALTSEPCQPDVRRLLLDTAAPEQVQAVAGYTHRCGVDVCASWRNCRPAPTHGENAVPPLTREPFPALSVLYTTDNGSPTAPVAVLATPVAANGAPPATSPTAAWCVAGQELGPATRPPGLRG
jgi:hypothetical protein